MATGQGGTAAAAPATGGDTVGASDGMANPEGACPWPDGGLPDAGMIDAGAEAAMPDCDDDAGM
jgi:hypothetical protein